MDIKDAYLHGTVGVVKSINVNADKLIYNLADKGNTPVEITLPQATHSANGLLSTTDKQKLDSLFLGTAYLNLTTVINKGSETPIYKKVTIVQNDIAGYGIWIHSRKQHYLLNSGGPGMTTISNTFWELGTNINTTPISANRGIRVKMIATSSSATVTLYIAVEGFTYFQIVSSGKITIEDSSKDVYDGITSSTTGWVSCTSAKWTDSGPNVTQHLTTSNAEYPLLLAASGQNATTTGQSYFDSGITLNPYTNTLTGVSVYESLLKWGNTVNSGVLSPLDVAMDGLWSTNRLSFMPESGIQVEYSTDGGITWLDYALTLDQKRSFVTTGLECSLHPGKNTKRQKINLDRVRITITAESGKTYFSLKKIFLYMNQAGASVCKLLIEKAHCGSDTTFVLSGVYNIAGWSGWNSIPFMANFGGSDTKTSNIRRLRFTYYFQEYSSGYGETDDTKAVTSYISKLNMIGDTSWVNSGGNLSFTGHIYSYDINKNTTFPAALTAANFNGPIKGSLGLLNVNSGYHDLGLKFFSKIRACVSTVSTDGKRYAGTANSYGFPAYDNANSMLWLGSYDGNYGHLLGFSSDGNIYSRYISNGSFPAIVNGGSWKRLAFTTDIIGDTKVTQTDITNNDYYRVLLSGSATNTTETTTSGKSDNLLFNPSTGNLKTNSLNLNGDIIVNDDINHDRYIKWQHNNTDNYGWRIGYLGDNNTHGNDNNALVFDSYRNTQGWATALKIDLGSLNATFTGTVTASTFSGKLDWSNLLNIPTSFKPSEHYHGELTWPKDTRSVATQPSDYKSKFKFVGIKTPSVIGLDSSIGWASIIGWKGYSDNSGPKSWELASDNYQRLHVRSGSGIQNNGSGNEDWSAWNTLAYITDNFPSNQINKLTGYTKATALEALDAEDSLNAALGKLEYKTDFIYNDLIGGENNANVIDKWSEIKDFIAEVGNSTDITDVFVTRKTALTITGQKTFNQYLRFIPNTIGGHAYGLLNIDSNGANKNKSTAGIGFLNDGGIFSGAYIGWGESPWNSNNNLYVNDTTFTYKKYKVLHTNNSHITNGVITINGVSITPLTEHQSLANYLPLSGGTMKSDAYISWNASELGDSVSDWSTIKGHGLRIISSTSENSNAPTTYCTALHVRGSYGFKLASLGGATSNKFFIQNISNNTWNELLHSSNTHIKDGVITINGTSITPITAHQDLSNYVTLNTALTITANKTFKRDTDVLITLQTTVSNSVIKFITSEATSFFGLKNNGHLFYTDSHWDTVYDVLSSANYTSYTPILNSYSTHATKDSVIYAPTSAGTKGNILISNGSGAPSWSTLSALGNLPNIAYNYHNGYLVKTNILSNSNIMITFRIEGNGYTKHHSILTTGNFYNYTSQNTILNASAYHHDLNFGNITVFCYNDLVYLWFSHTAQYQSFIVTVYGTNDGNQTNRVTEITNEAIPTSGVSRKTVITPRLDHSEHQISKTITSKDAGWYRIAQSEQNIINCEGTFEILGTSPNYHTSAKIVSGTSYGTNVSLSVIDCHNWTGATLTKVRVVYHTTWNGKYAFLEVYKAEVADVTILAKTVNGFGWTLIDPVVVSVPSGYSTKTRDLVSNTLQVDSVSASSGSFSSAITLTGTTANDAILKFSSLGSNTCNYIIWPGNTHKDCKLAFSYDNNSEAVYYYMTNEAIYPAVTNTYTLGTLNNIWKSIYGTVTNVAGEAATVLASRHVWFSDSVAETKRNYNDDFMYNPTNNLLTVGSITGSAAQLTSTNIVIDKKFTSLTNASWTDTGYTFTNLESGTYAILVTSTNLVASGIMSVYKNITDSVSDEIPLHVYGTAGWRPYLRTSANKLLISSNDVTAATNGRTVTIKIAKIL